MIWYQDTPGEYTSFMLYKLNNMYLIYSYASYRSSWEIYVLLQIRISSVASSLSCSLIYLYIWGISWNIIHNSLGSLCFALLLLMLGTFTNPVLLFFICLSWLFSIQLTHLITERVYLNDDLCVISLVDCYSLTDLMTNCSSETNVLT